MIARRRFLRALPVLASALVAVIPLAAQSPEPKRPRLADGADTNNAGDYFRFGQSVLRTSPKEAERAFYWASRIDPSWADPLFARRIALHLADMRQLGDYLDRRPAVMRSTPVRYADSLQYEALLRNPLMHQRMSRDLLETYFEKATGLSSAFIDWGQQDMEMQGWLAYTNGEYEASTKAYAKAIKRYPKAAYLHGDRARSFFHQGQTDSAVVEMQTMIDALRTADEKTLVRYYDNKALAEYQIGLIWLTAGDIAKAREAFERALVEDLGFYMAHVQLAEIAIAAKDGPMAISELHQAVELAPREPSLRLRYAKQLMGAQQWAEALPHLEEAIALDPWFAEPYLLVGLIRESAGDEAEARLAFSTYLARSPKFADRLRQTATAKLAALNTSQ